MSLFGNLFNKNKKNSSQNIVLSPVTGEIRDLKECQDPVFAGEMVGKGSLIIPSEGKVYSPVDGEISTIADTGHAVGITSDKGLEILVHIGLDTVELKGEPYTNHVEDGQKVKAGDLLIDFDIAKIEASGKAIETPILITNHDGKEVKVIAKGQVSHGQELIEVIG